MKGGLRALRNTLIVLLALAAVVCIAAILIARSDWLRQQVRVRIVEEVEKASGGRAEIGEFLFDWKTLTAEVRPFTLHGTEPPGVAPLFRADSVRLGLRVISLLERKVDFSSLEVIHAQLHVIAAPDGSTNIPGPKTPSSRNAIERVFDLAIRKFSLRDGSVIYNSERFPLDIEGHRLSASLAYERFGTRYRGTLSAAQVRVVRPLAQPLEAAFESTLLLEKNRISIQRARLGMAKSSVDISGRVYDLASPRGEFSGNAHLVLSELARPLRLPVTGVGEVDWSGRGTFAAAGRSLNLEGRAAGHGLAYRYRRFDLRDASFSANLKLAPSRLSLDHLTAAAFGGHFRGALDLEHWRDLQVEGTADSLSFQALARSINEPGFAWSGGLSGPVDLHGEITSAGFHDTLARGRITVQPATGGIPVSGFLDLVYDQRAAELRFGDSNLHAASTRAAFSGTFGKALVVDASSGNLNDALPAFRLAGVAPPDSLPLVLKNGTAHVQATVFGPLNDPRIEGHGRADSFVWDNRSFDRLESDFTLDHAGLSLRGLDLAQGQAELKGDGRLGLIDWRIADAAPITGSLAVKNAAIQEVLAEAGSKLAITGTGSANLRLSGSFGSPHAEGDLHATHVTAWDEIVDRVEGNVEYQDGTIRISKGVLEDGRARAYVSGSYRRSASDWSSGGVDFNITASTPDFTQFEALAKHVPGFSGAAEVKASGKGVVAESRLRLVALDGQAALKNAALDGSPLGDLSATMKTSGGLLHLEASGALLHSPFRGAGEWRLDGDRMGHARIDFEPVSLYEIAMFLGRVDSERQKVLQQRNFSGSAEGSLSIEGPYDRLDALKAQLRLTDIHVTGNPELESQAGAKPEDLTLHNDGPVVVDLTTKSADIHSAKFVARDTRMSAAGKIGFGSSGENEIHLDGEINLAILRLFNRGLLASGHASISTTIRGTLAKPDVGGRMELRQASLFLPDVPNGVDNANGVIVFDRARATIQSLTAETGGGTLSFGGFVGFGSVLVYRLQATADQVRYRTPDGVSITMSGLLTLVGTSENSLVSGSVTVVRANLTPLTDLGGMLAEAARPAPVPSAPSDYLRGIQFDVQIESAQSLEVHTTLARNLQASVDLRLRGTPAHPSLLGRLAVDQGEIEFFGTKYLIDRGEAVFSNPLRIDPVIDLNLETRVRGIQVNLVLTGPLQKLNLSYRSDPPLDSGQIIALLAVGRDPNAIGSVSPSATQSGPFSGGAGSLLASALTAPISGRIEQLFGGTRIKIDPEATDLTTIPQARLIFEQPVSKDITLTYITNLNRSDQQIVRVQWDVSRTWSAVASREENGIFDLVFLYRKRFK